MAYWTLAWIDIQDRRFGDAIANAQSCRKTAATPFDRKAGTIASATGLLLEGRFEEGLAQLLAQRTRRSPMAGYTRQAASILRQARRSPRPAASPKASTC